MILGYENKEVVKMAEQNRNSHFDGVVQYNYVTGELYGCSMSQNEEENPKNPVIEVFRLYSNSDLSQNCNECPFEDSHYVDEEFDNAYECCLSAYIDYDFDDDFEDNYKENVEIQIREVLMKYYMDDLEKLNDIRLGYYDIFCSPTVYHNEVFNDTFIEDSLDDIVDRNLEYGFSVATSPKDMLFGELEEVIGIYERLGFDYGLDHNSNNDEKELSEKILVLLEDYRLDDALDKIVEVIEKREE